MIEFFLPNSRAILPTFRTNCQVGLILPRWGLRVSFAHNTTTNPCSLLSRHKTLSGICTNTKHPQPRPKTPLFLAWFWKWAKWTTVWANWTPSGQNVWKVAQGAGLSASHSKCADSWRTDQHQRSRFVLKANNVLRGMSTMRQQMLRQSSTESTDIFKLSTVQY